MTAMIHRRPRPSAPPPLEPDGSLSQRGRNVMQHTLMNRFGEAGELLGTALWLLDDARSGFVTGQTIAVDGGFLAATEV